MRDPLPTLATTLSHWTQNPDIQMTWARSNVQVALNMRITERGSVKNAARRRKNHLQVTL
jgi:hypothetical protein